VYRSQHSFTFQASHRPPTAASASDDCDRILCDRFDVALTFACGVLVNGRVIDAEQLATFDHFLSTTLDGRHLVGILSTPTGPQFALATCDADRIAAEQQLATTVDSGDGVQPITPETLARAFYDICRLRWPETDLVRVTVGDTSSEYAR
jgi:6-pyruvoyl-tetrahydropterin synthase